MSEPMDSASTKNGGRGRHPSSSDDSHPSGADIGWGITGTLLSGLIVWGGAGWLLDRWLDTRVFVVIGMLLGLASIWAAHIGFDRMLGYGLKYTSGFNDTHLGRIGRQAAGA